MAKKKKEKHFQTWKDSKGNVIGSRRVRRNQKYTAREKDLKTSPIMKEVKELGLDLGYDYNDKYGRQVISVNHKYTSGFLDYANRMIKKERNIEIEENLSLKHPIIERATELELNEHIVDGFKDKYGKNVVWNGKYTKGFLKYVTSRIKEEEKMVSRYGKETGTPITKKTAKSKEYWNWYVKKQMNQKKPKKQTSKRDQYYNKMVKNAVKEKWSFDEIRDETEKYNDKFNTFWHPNDTATDIRHEREKQRKKRKR